MKYPPFPSSSKQSVQFLFNLICLKKYTEIHKHADSLSGNMHIAFLVEADVNYCAHSYSSWTIISRSQFQFIILFRYPQLLNGSACIAFSQHVTTSGITNSLSSAGQSVNFPQVKLQQVVWDFFLQVYLGFHFCCRLISFLSPIKSGSLF